MVRSVLVACLLAALSSVESAAQEALIGPSTSQSDALEIVASRTDPLLAVSIDGSGDLVRTGDGGASFSRITGTGASGLVTADFCIAGACYAAGLGGVFVSQDGAQSFVQGGALPQAIADVAASPTVGGEVWALLADGTLHRSVDFASTWTQVGSMGMSASPPRYAGLNAHPTRAGEWIAHSNTEVWFTANSGATSTQFRPSGLGAGFILDAALLETNWVVLAEDTSTGLVQTEVLLSTTGTNSFAQRAVSSSITRGFFRLHPGNPNELWIGDYGGTFARSTDGGNTFTYPSIATGEESTDIAFSADALRPAYVATEFSVGVMDLASLQYTAAPGSGSPFPVRSLALDPRDPEHLAVIAEPSIFETFDRGRTWIDRGTPGFAVTEYKDVRFDAAGRLLLNSRAIHRHDGTSWQMIAFFSSGDIEALAASQVDPDTLYAFIRGLNIGSIARTTDGGASWALVDVCTACSARADALWAIERVGQPVRLVLLWDFARRLEYTDDLGATLIPIGTNGARAAVGQSPRNGARMTYWEGNTAYITDDGFDTVGAPLTTTYGRAGTAISSENPDYLVGVETVGFTGQFPTLGRSTDGGVTWVPMPGWVAGADDVFAITMAADDRQVLVAADTGLHAIDARDVVSTPVCVQNVPNSVGRLATLELVGSDVTLANSARLEATGLPPFTTCLAVAGDDDGFVPAAGGSLGTLCVSGQLGRFNSAVGFATASGAFGFQLDVNALPRGAGFVPATAGSRWTFQCWYRDLDMGQPSSHFTSAVEVVWAP